MIKIILLLISTLAFFTVLYTQGQVVYASVETGDKSEIDISGKDDGYIRVRFTAQTNKRLKVQVLYDGSDIIYTYNLNGNGDWETFTLQSGNGEYTIKVMENSSDTRYATIQTAVVQVVYNNDFAPFLVPSQFVNFSSSSTAVIKSTELTAGLTEDMEKLKRIFSYIVENVVYDRDKAAKVISGEIRSYVPDIEVVAAELKGICFDYSALFAAMLRSQGIPAKLIMGYVNTPEGPVYHAWNEVHIQGVGWIMINSEVFFDGQAFSRLDGTFAANNADGSDTEYMKNDNNYITDKMY